MKLFGYPVVEKDLGPMPEIKVLDWSQWVYPSKPGYYMAFDIHMKKWVPVKLEQSRRVTGIGTHNEVLEVSDFSHWLGPITIEVRPE